MDSPNIEARLNALEKRNRLLGLGLAVMALALAGSIGLGVKNWPLPSSNLDFPRTLEAETLVLKDLAGNDRMVLEATSIIFKDMYGMPMMTINGSENCSIQMNDEGGNERVSLEAYDGHPRLSMNSINGSSIKINGSIPTISMMDFNDSKRIQIACYNGTGPSISFFDEEGKIRYIAGEFGDGPFTLFNDETQKTRISLNFEENLASFSIKDQSGNLRTVLGSTRIGRSNTDNVELLSEGSLTLFNKDGKVTAKLPR